MTSSATIFSLPTGAPLWDMTPAAERIPFCNGKGLQTGSETQHWAGRNLTRAYAKSIRRGVRARKPTPNDRPDFVSRLSWGKKTRSRHDG
jgi:hypothetical protein